MGIEFTQHFETLLGCANSSYC